MQSRTSVCGRCIESSVVVPGLLGPLRIFANLRLATLARAPPLQHLSMTKAMVPKTSLPINPVTPADLAGSWRPSLRGE